MHKRWYRLLLPAVMLLLLSGCLFRPPDDLYKLPEMSAGYDRLDAAIKSVRSGLESEFGASIETAVIASGDNTATIQLQDLDGDGVRESALTFVRVPGIEKAIKIYIFRQMGEDYRVTGVVEGDGAAIYSVDYVDLNGSGYKELVVNWQVSTGVYQLGAYTLDDLTATAQPEEAGNGFAANIQPDRSEVLATELLLTGCSGYRLMDVEQDGTWRTVIAVARIDSAGINSQVEVFGWKGGAFVSQSSASLSAGAVSLNRMQSNYLNAEYYYPALYLVCDLADGTRAIDVLAFQEGKLVNLALDPETGVSRNLLQNYKEVSLADINGDYVLELPAPRQVPSYGESASSNFWLIDWSQYGGDGRCSQVLTTYHNVADSWYLVVPDAWKDKITISRNDSLSGQREVVFSLWMGRDREPMPFLSIYRLTGNNRTTRSTQDDRFVLRDEGSIIYAAKFYDCPWDCGLDKADLMEGFKTIQASWYSDS